MRSTGRGYCLAELLVVLGVLSLCLGLGATSLAPSLDRQETRAVAQASQAAAAWAQVGVIWRGGACEVSMSDGGLTVTHDRGLCGGEFMTGARSVAISSNVSRWTTPGGISLRFLGGFACPDSGGSLYLQGLSGVCRVVVRPESGLTARSWVPR